jgi:hypothetical protein
MFPAPRKTRYHSPVQIARGNNTLLFFSRTFAGKQQHNAEGSPTPCGRKKAQQVYRTFFARQCTRVPVPFMKNRPGRQVVVSENLNALTLKKIVNFPEIIYTFALSG